MDSIAPEPELGGRDTAAEGSWGSEALKGEGLSTSLHTEVMRFSSLAHLHFLWLQANFYSSSSPLLATVKIGEFLSWKHF